MNKKNENREKFDKLNWIIKNTSKLQYHTNLKVLLEPIKEDLDRFKWLIYNLEVNTKKIERLPINHDKDWFLISSEEMEVLRNSDSQIIWGTFCGIDKNEEVEITNNSVPHSEEIPGIWKNGKLQIEQSIIEIIAWDSSYTIVKFTNERLSLKFKKYFEEAIELEKYKSGEN